MCKGKVESEGVDITSTSAFMTSTSGQTQERSKIPPYITNIVQDQPQYNNCFITPLDIL